MNEVVWLGVLGLLLCGYFALAGYDYGAGILLSALPKDESERRELIGGFGPFFLGNEVWLVAAVGVLFGAFPRAEGILLAGTYPLVVIALLGVVTLTAGIQLRSRRPADRHRAWDLAISAGCAVAAVGWGGVLGAILQGLPVRDGHELVGGVGYLIGGYPLLTGATLLGLFLLHGATFLALRLEGRLAARANRQARWLVLPVAVVVVTAAVVGMASPEVRAAVQQPAIALAGVAAILAALAGAGWALRSKRHRLALACTAIASILPVVVVGAGIYPNLVPSTVDAAQSISVAEAAASAGTLELIGWFAIPLLPTVIVLQWLSWRVFRARSPLYF